MMNKLKARQAAAAAAPAGNSSGNSTGGLNVTITPNKPLSEFIEKILEYVIKFYLGWRIG